MRPSSGSQLALCLQFGELRLIVGVGNRTRPQSITNGEGDVVRSHDLANLIPTRVKKILLVVG